MRIFFFILTFLSSGMGYGQTGRTTVDHLEDLIKKKEYRTLEVESARSVAKFSKQNEIDSLITYAYYVGIAVGRLRGIPAAQNRLMSIINNDIVQTNAPGVQIASAYLMAANLLGYEGDSRRAYNMLQKLSGDHVLKNKIKDLQYRVESTMALFSMRLGLYAISSNHYRRSLELFPREKVKTEEYFSALNSMGIAMFYRSKLDSSLYYFNATKDFLKNLDDSPVNKYYRSGMLDANISNVYAEQGESNKSIKYGEQAIDKYRKFLNTDTNYPQKPSTQRNLLFCMDNLATTLLETGDYTKAKNLYTFALTEKQRILGENDPEVYTSYLALAGVSLSRGETAGAINYVEKALAIIRKIGDTLTLYDAEAYSKLAQAYFKMHDEQKAAYYFQKAYKIFDKLNGDDLSIQDLDFLNKYALFKAKTNDSAGAEILADRSLRYSLKTNQEYSLPVAMQLLSEMNVHLQLKKYHTSHVYADKAIATFDKLISNAPTILDSINFENFKVPAVLGRAKSAYYLLEEKNRENIQKILDELEAASTMFERRKRFYSNDEDVNVTIDSYKEINDFINLLQLDLFRITNDTRHLDSIIQKNESLVYTRLKKALNNRQLDMRFKDVPSSVRIKESQIKALLADALKNNKAEPGNVNSYFKQSKRWKDFLAMLEKDYPDYYDARYGTVPQKTMEDYKQEVAKGSQVVRFYIIDQKIYALVISQTENRWVALPAKDLSAIISKLKGEQNIGQIGYFTYKLYQQLWEPIEPFIHEKRVTIIPDGIMYNISFDMLTSKPVKNSRELITFSLLKKYAFSYQYSLDALKSRKSISLKYSGISVFAPSFSEEEKKDYLVALKSDTMKIDAGYLKLLPLPFSSDFASRLRSNFESTVFLGKESTISNFKNKAGNHSIIYIGTHAESNNQFPEYSRLFFAKDLDTPTADNSLYLYDIYNQNLNADLAVLTGCETGQSNFFPGEGMISMAHAFSYAGSKSMLTGLWKIDEHASIIIMGAFYKNLEDGMTKDVALQQAKLSYLEQSNGRMLSPQYWAGLVIMGDTGPIEFETHKRPYYFISSGILLIILESFYFYRKRLRKDRKRPILNSD